MDAIPPLSEISQYLEGYYNDRMGGLDQWEIFWDYKCSVEHGQGSIFDAAHLLSSSSHLLAYLCLFGMGRGSTRLLKVGSSRRFATVLKVLSRPIGRQLLALDFDHVQWIRDPFLHVWNDLGQALSELRVSTTHIMRSKILMAAWGEMPALDERFQKVFQSTWNFWGTNPFPAKVLSALRARYLANWQQEIQAAPRAWTHTSANGNPIPHARLLDVSFWYHYASHTRA